MADDGFMAMPPRLGSNMKEYRYNNGMKSDYPFRANDHTASQVIDIEDPTAVVSPCRSKLELRWLVAGLVVVAILGNLIVPACIQQFKHLFSSFDFRFHDLLLSDCIGAFAYGCKLGELISLGIFLGLGNTHWAYRLLVIAFGTLVLCSAHIIGHWLSRWDPSLAFCIACYSVSFFATIFFGSFIGLIGRWNHWRLERENSASNANQAVHQFDTRLLFKLMIAVAICVPLLKATLSLAVSQDIGRNEIFEITLWSIWLVAALSCLVTVQLIAFLVPKTTKTATAFGLLVLAGPFLFQWVANFILPFRMTWSAIAMAYWVELGLVGSLSFLFLFLRRMGYQLRTQS